MNMVQKLWTSKFVFILAALGAAAGLGNLWRFPYLAYENGGGAFLFAYFICLYFFAKPLMMMEIAFGQGSRVEIVEAMGKTKAKKFGKFTAWFAIGLLVVLAGYYASIIGWGFNFLVASPALEWGSDSQSFFHNSILGLSESPAIVGSLSLHLVLGILVTYICVYFSIFKGVLSVGKVIKWTVSLPFILLIVLFLNTLTLDGAMDGFKYFLLPEWSELKNVSLWKDAISMSFFSTNVGLVLTMLYASFNKKETEIFKSAWLISIGDLLVSVVAGLAMFGTLGYMSQLNGVDISEVVQSGPTLAFVTLPTALAALPVLPGLFAVIFFLAILTLAIDSMFAIVECIGATFRNQFKLFKKLPLEKSTALLAFIFFMWSLCFATGNGLYRLDVVDHYIFGHFFYIGMILQLIVIGWYYGADKIRKMVNETSNINIGIWFEYLIKYFAPIAFLLLYVLTLPEEFSQTYSGYDMSFVISWGIIPLVIVFVGALLLSQKKDV